MKLDEKVVELMGDVYKSLKDYEEVLLTNEEYENDNDLVWELPRTHTVSKHGYYIEFAITSITKGGDIIAKGLGEDWGDVISIKTDELTYGEAVELLGWLNN